MIRRVRSIIAVTAVYCTALSVAACGAADSTAGNDGLCAPSPGTTATSIDLGLLYSGSGYGADASTHFRAGVDARLGAVNAAGGINGRKVSYSVQDDESVSEVNLSAGRKLIERNGALGILQYSAEPTGSADLLEHRGVPTVNGQIVEPELATRSNVFSYSRPIAQRPASSAWGEFVASMGGRRAVTISVELSATTQNLAQLAADSLRAANVEVVRNLEVPAGPFDPAEFGAQIRAAGADSVVAMVPATSFYQIVAGAHAAGADLKVALGNPATYDRAALTGTANLPTNIYSFLDYAPFELGSAAHSRFLAAVAAYAPEFRPQVEGSVLVGWISADLMLRGIQAAGPCPTRQSVLRGLRGLNRFDADGLLPAPIDLTKGMANIAPCYDYVQVTRNGAGFTPVSPFPRCGKVLGPAN